MYISQLPGMQGEWFNDIADDEQVTAAGVWDDVQETTATTFKEDVIQEFGKRLQLKQITQSVDLGKSIDTTQLTTPAVGTEYGLLIQTMLPNQQCACSNLQKIFIQSINFYWTGANPNPTFTVNFYDADLHTLEYTTTVANAVLGWNAVYLDKEFSARRLEIFVTGNFDNYVELDLSNFFLQNFGGVNYGWTQWGSWGSFLSFGFGGCGCQAMVQGIQYTTGNENTGSNSFGLSVVLSTKCSFDQIICTNKQHFASAWQHCLAIELLNYRINSSRLNKFTTITKDQAVALQTLMTQKYRGGVDQKTMLEYPGKLQSAITSISLNDTDCCLRANDRYIWREIRT